MMQVEAPTVPISSTGERTKARPGRTVLDPVSRASEILFGLIMVLTFTLSLDATEAGRADVHAVLIGMLGCNLAWAIIDAVMYLMGARGEHRLAVAALKEIQEAQSPAAGRSVVADYLPPAILPTLTEANLESIRLHLDRLPPQSLQARFGLQDYLAAFSVFALVFLCLFPVAVPFIIVKDVELALRLSNAVAVIMLFFTGYAFGRQVGRPWLTGFLMVTIGVALVAVAIAFGG